jgi:peptidyl-dipeptidase A
MSSCTDNPNVASPAGPATADEANKFLTDAEKRLLGLAVETSRADWVKSTYVTDDTEALAAVANENLIAATTELAEQGRRFESLNLSPEAKRKLLLLKLSLTLPAPKDPTERAELTKIAASMEGDYGKGKYCPEGDKGKCLSLPELEQIIGNSRDPEELKRVWIGWHQIAQPIRKDYVRFVELSNKGAKEMGFKDTGAMWRAKYDMEPDAFAAEIERLWQNLNPLNH